MTVATFAEPYTGHLGSPLPVVLPFTLGSDGNDHDDFAMWAREVRDDFGPPRFRN